MIVQGAPKTGLADRARRTMGAEVVVVERIRGRNRWWKRPGYRVITVYSDGARFYRRPFGRTILGEVVVYERGGRYYINDYQWKRHRNSANGRDGDADRDRRDDRDHHDNGNHYGWDNH